MTHDLQASTDRLRRIRDGERLASVYGEPYSAAMDWQRIDQYAVINAYFTEHDETAIDEEWLRSVGFEHVVGSPDGFTALEILHTHAEYKDREGDRRWELADNRVQWTLIPRLLKPKTRGQLRRLAAVLGIQLTERQP